MAQDEIGNLRDALSSPGITAQSLSSASEPGVKVVTVRSLEWLLLRTAHKSGWLVY